MREVFSGIRWVAVCIPLLAFALLLSGCRSPEKKVAVQLDHLREQWSTNLQHQVDLPEQLLDWNSAVDLMLAGNLKLRQGRTEITNSYEAVQQIFKDLIPNLNMRAGLSKRISDIHNVTANDITFSADSFFNIPGIVNFAARLYAARLYHLRTTAAYELARREQIIELYRLFFSAEELRDQTMRLEMQRATAEAMQQVDPFTGRLMLTEMETRELAHARETRALQERASELLGSRDYQWKFSNNGLPDLRYHENPLPLADTNRVAQLQMKLLAVELEAARAQLNGLKLRYWPELNIFVTSPPIYQRNSGQERWWDADDLRASADLFWSIDTRGQIARSIRMTKRQQALQIERFRQESLSLMNRLLFTQELINSVERQLARVDAQLGVLLAVPPAQNYPAIEKYAFDYRSLSQQQLQLKRELSELNALFWFVDDYAWPGQLALDPAAQTAALPPNH